MIDHHGAEWLPVAEVAARIDVRPGTVYAWLSRGIIRTHRIDRRAWLCMADVYAAERTWRQRAKGHQRVVADIDML